MSRTAMKMDLVTTSMNSLYTLARDKVTQDRSLRERINNGEIVTIFDGKPLEHSLLRSRLFNVKEDSSKGYREEELGEQRFYVLNKKSPDWAKRLLLRINWRQTQLYRSAESVLGLPNYPEIKFFMFVVMDDHEEGFRLKVAVGHSNFLILMSEEDFDNSYGLIKDVEPKLYETANKVFQKVLAMRKKTTVKA